MIPILVRAITWFFLARAILRRVAGRQVSGQGVTEHVSRRTAR